MKKYLLLFTLLVCATIAAAQEAQIRGQVKSGSRTVPYATLSLSGTSQGAMADSTGTFEINQLNPGSYKLRVSGTGIIPQTQEVKITSATDLQLVNFEVAEDKSVMDEVVVTGTLRPVSRLESPIPVEVYTPKFFLKNPTPSLFDAVGLINGVRPQLNCNVCNTGDIHINGMEGPYTLILIDGMPIVSALSTVYGLSGIPNSMVERIEVVKGPGAALYGSEAMGGIINVITKNPTKAPAFSFDVFSTSWGEYSADASVKFKAGKAQNLFGVNYFNYQNRKDNNGDNFTDITLQNRISLFNKIAFERRAGRVASLGVRFVSEDRFGGDIRWNKAFRGGDSLYGESVYTRRAELFGLYQLPLKERILLQYSYNWHHQNSYYGTTSYNASQQVAFAQLYWDKDLTQNNNLLLGASYRYTYYDDNTPATAGDDSSHPANRPAVTPLPGIFVQDEWKLNPQNTLLTGLRYDYDRYHGSIVSPRIAYKWSPNKNNTLRGSFGTGFRVVNLFTEDHAALTGARKVDIKAALRPEQSINSNLNYVLKVPLEKVFMNFDVTGFYSYFTNKIIGNYDIDPNKIVYDNLKGHAVSRGVSVNVDIAFTNSLKVLAGVTYTDVYNQQDNGAGQQVRTAQLFASRWSGNYLISYTFPKNFTVDFTGAYYGPMRLPLQKNDFRPEYSPWFSLANIQVTRKLGKGFEVYGGLKNLFNFVPRFTLLRTFDPFDKTAADPVSNPKGYTFDTEYNYAPLQGIRGFLGVRYSLFR